MRFRVLFTTAAACVALGSQATADEPTADQIMGMVRHTNALQNSEFTGTLENRSDRTEERFRMRMADGTVRWEFGGANPMALLLEFGDEGSALYEESGGRKRLVPADRLGEKFRGSDLNYEDLSMRFLYWPKPRKEAVRTVKRQDCWVILLLNPDKSGPYQWVRVWVEQKGGGIMKMEAFDGRNNKLREYEVTKAQKVDDNWFLERMQVNSFQPGSTKPTGLSFLDLDKPLRVGGR